jgi:hypothetical protein
MGTNVQSNIQNIPSGNLDTSSSPTPTNQNTTEPTGQLFSSSQFAQYSYLISGTTPYDAKTKKALSGFTVIKKLLTDGSTQITLNAQNPAYKTQIYTVKPGEKLYLIESNLSDDSSTTKDAFPGDDQAVLVDASGIIIQQPQ